MRNKRYNPIQATAVALALLLLSFLPACSDDDGGNGPDLPDNQLYTLTIHLQPSAPYTPVTSKTPRTNAAWNIGGCSSTAKIRRHNKGA